MKTITSTGQTMAERLQAQNLIRLEKKRSDVYRAMQEAAVIGVSVGDYVIMAQESNDEIELNEAVLKYHWERKEAIDAYAVWGFARAVFNV